jgi:sigma-B regulation protein RsbU (phosphoserine phosphatase)
LKSHSSLTVIIAAAILLQTISAVQYYSTHDLLADELEKRAESEMTTKAVIVKNALNMAENSLNGHLWDAKRNIAYPDSMYEVLEWVLRSHPNLLGCGIAFVPDFYPEKGRLYEPYVYRQLKSQGKEVFVRKQVAGPYHDYTLSGFYKKTMKRKTTFWSYPYYDDITNSHIVTFCRPIHNEKKDIVAVFGLDIDIKWLGDTLNYRHIYPSSYNFLLTETGQLIVGPQHESDKKREEMEFIIRQINDSTVKKSLSNSGRSTVLPIEDSDGNKGLVFYANFKGNPKWQIALVCYDKEVFAKLKTMRRHTGILMIVGLLVLGLIISRFAKNDRKLHKANLEKERIGGELRVASQIQQNMLPQEEVRGEWLEVRGSLVPAKEVGGDLYDYFIRDEKLFFCIGDVSGKGAASAMMMAVVQTKFRDFSAHENNPARIMQNINIGCCQNNKTNMFVTLFIGVLDLPTGRLRYCDAGHDAPILIDNGQWIMDNSAAPKNTDTNLIINCQLSIINCNPNLPVGVFDDFTYSMQETQIESNSTIFLYSDGLTEAKNSQRKQFGLERIEYVLGVCTGLQPKDILEKMTDAVHEFVKDAEQSDDLTMMAIRYTSQHYECTLSETLVIKNDVKEVTKFSEFMKSVLEKLDIEKSLGRQLRLAAEEAVVNVIDYAYPVGKEGEIEVRMMSDGKTLKTIITDSGVAFDPTAKEKADTTLSAEDRQIGGLGILLVRELMDSVNYERINKQNILTLTKKYN